MARTVKPMSAVGAPRWSVLLAMPVVTGLLLLATSTSLLDRRVRYQSMDLCQTTFSPIETMMQRPWKLPGSVGWTTRTLDRHCGPGQQRRQEPSRPLHHRGPRPPPMPRAVRWQTFLTMPLPTGLILTDIQMETQTRAGGATRLLLSRDRHLPRLATTSARSIANTCWMLSRISEPDLWQDGWGRYAAALQTCAGRTSRAWTPRDWKARACENGPPLSFEQHINIIAETRMTLRTDRRRDILQWGRPRSLCNHRFQLLPLLHPFYPNSLNLPRHRSWRRRVFGSGRPPAEWEPPQAAQQGMQHSNCPPQPHFPPYNKPEHRPHKHHPRNRSVSRPGPKSGFYLRFFVLVSSTKGIDGVRVPPASAAGGGLASAPAGAGKHCGEALHRASATFSLKGAKRAFRRARQRASRSEQGGTWYRGSWHTQQTLGSLPMPHLSSRRKSGRRSTPATGGASRLDMLCWNAGGLSSSLYQELIAWCDLQSSLELVVVQETHIHQ